MIRSPWDYQDDPDAFLAVLEQIDAATTLLNGLAAVRWNLRKTYLRELEAAGVPTIPTVWFERLDPGGTAGLFDAVGADEIVVKPVVGANASGAFRISRAAPRAADVEAHYASRTGMAQPFVPAIVVEGRVLGLRLRQEGQPHDPEDAQAAGLPCAGGARRPHHGGRPRAPRSSRRPTRPSAPWTPPSGSRSSTPAPTSSAPLAAGSGRWRSRSSSPRCTSAWDAGAPRRFAEALAARMG